MLYIPYGSDYHLSHKTIVIDLDSTVIYTFNKYGDLVKLKLHERYDDLSFELKSRIFVFELNGKKYWTVERPFCREFLNEVYSIFKYVIFWTAGTREYAEMIIKKLHLYIPNPHFVFSRDDIKTIYETKNGSESIKDLRLLIDVLKKKHNVYLKISDILVIDDIETTFSKNVDNAILIPEYKPEPTFESLTSEDNSLEKIIDWIMVNIHKDIDKTSKKHIFIDV